MKKTVQKGCYLYLKYGQRREIIKTVLMYALALSIYAIGYINLHTNKSLFTVIAILGILPASKSAVQMIMFLRFRSLKKEEYEEISRHAGNLDTLYEMVFTTTEKSYYVPNLVYTNGTLCMLCSQSEEELHKLEKHIKETLEKDGFQNILVKAFQKKDTYLKRVDELNSHFALEKQSDESGQKLFATLRAVAL